MLFKDKYEDYTESEFLEFLRPLFNSNNGLTGKAREKYVIKTILHFEKITEHPEKSALFSVPHADRADSPEGILREVKRWRTENGKPGLKSS